MNNKMIKRLADLREDKDISKLAFSKLMNISRTTYYNYEAGITEPDIDNLIKIANYHKVSVDYLIGNDIKLDEPKEINSYNEAVTFLESHKFMDILNTSSPEEIIELAKIIKRLIESFNHK